jgi:hypothetical protein
MHDVTLDDTPVGTGPKLATSEVNVGLKPTAGGDTSNDPVQTTLCPGNTFGNGFEVSVRFCNDIFFILT